MKTIDEMLIGCEHDGSYIPVNEVKRLMREYAQQFQELNQAEVSISYCECVFPKPYASDNSICKKCKRKI